MSRGRLPPSRILYHSCSQAALLLLSFFLLTAQQKESAVELVHADSLVGRLIDGEKAREYIGHVRFRHGNTVITCERAIQYFSSNRVSMDGVVEVSDDTLRMVGTRGTYYSDAKVAEIYERVLLEEPGTILRASSGKYFVGEKKAYFKGDVYVRDSVSVTTADELTYFRDDEHSFADGNVKIDIERDGMTILGGHFENYKKRRYSKITRNPVIIQIDTNAQGKKDTLRVTALVLESYRDSTERLVATDSVAITRGSLAAEAGSCIYYTASDSIVLEESPYVWYADGKYDDNQVSGESIYIKLRERKLQSVFVRGRGVAISRADSLYPDRFNQTTGQEIFLAFADDKIQQIDVVTTATSVYYLFDKGIGNGLNKTTGDKITMSFTDGRIGKITAKTDVEGEYYPEKLVKGKETDFNLPGFNWRDVRPGRKYRIGEK